MKKIAIDPNEQYGNTAKAADIAGMSHFMVKDLARKGIIPSIKAGYRTRLFPLNKLRETLASMEIK